MTDAQWIVAVVAGSAILLIILGVSWSRSPDPVRTRLDQLGVAGPRDLTELELQTPLLERVLTPLAGRLSRMGGRISGTASLDRVARQLDLAGNPSQISPAAWVGIRLVSAVVVGGIALVVLVLGHAAAGTTIAIVILGVASGYLLPNAWLSRQAKARQHQILKRLPDTLDLLSISMRAGVGFDQALGRVVDKIPGPLAEELTLALAEMRIGKPRRDALRDIGTRTDVRQLTSFIGAILQAEEMGVPIARVLDVQSQQLRIERRQRAEAAAARAPIKMLFPLVGCILPTLFIVILGPAIIAVAKQFSSF